jgi:RecG-like helicase
VATKKSVRRFAAPEEVDRDKLVQLCDSLGLAPISEISPRTQVRVGGEVRSIRVVPRAGAPSLEVTINDGRGYATAVFFGRRKIAGITPGRKMIVEGMVGTHDKRHLIVNPFYTLLP